MNMFNVLEDLMNVMVANMEEPLFDFELMIDFPANANQRRERIAPPYNQALGDSQLSAAEMRKKGNRAERLNKSQISGIPPRWDYLLVEPVEKNIYREHVTTAQRSELEVNAYRLDNHIEISGRAAPKPMLNFEEADLPVPAVLHVLSQPPLQFGDGPIALVVVATREMARGVHQVARGIQECTKVRSACLSCREPKQPQLEDLEKRPQICIATPGRLLTFLKEGRLNLLRCTYVVFDGADLMVDMGLEFQIYATTEWIRPDHQTQVWLTSRTQNVRPLCEDLLEDYVQVSIGVKPAFRNETAEHIVFVCDEQEKNDRLVALLQDIDNGARDKVIVFAESKQAVEDIVGLLVFREFPVIGIHGKKTDDELDWALASFRENGTYILVSTDVCLRKLDVVGGARFVINFDYPRCSDVYMMRLSHALNSGQTAVVYTLFTYHDKRHANDLVSILRDARQSVPVELKGMLKETVRDRRLGAGRRGKRCAL
ncbi:hypothetical protein HPB49_019503 [Dermacentor silvarum]|uniref:Uncharacterized protein n=1 Tax=Dermacentor silvarum TaxID=543639 RepID=A0ACB8DKQ8_DERSI|nr:hypothetical protein HPB49_019503 [Dermacentor silvarum]